MTEPARRRFKFATPCPVCGGHEGMVRGSGRRCDGYVLGDTGSYCRRVPSETPHPSDAGLFWHAANGAPQPPATPPSNGEVRSRIVETYDYTDAEGRLLYQVVRKDPKDFVQRRPDGAGGWIWNVKGVEPVPYRLPDVIAALSAGDDLYIVEGEKDAESVRRAGAMATCNSGGAEKWRTSDAAKIAAIESRSRIVVVADRDAKGEKHALDVRSKLIAAGIAPERIELRRAAKGKDASCHLDAGLGLADLKRFDAAPAPNASEATSDEPPLLGDEHAPAEETGEARTSSGAGGGRDRARARPAIQLSNRQLDAVVVDAVSALVRANDPPRLFMRTGAVVRVRRDEQGAPRIEHLSETALLEELSRCASWMALDRRGVPKPGQPRRALAGTVLAALTRDEGPFPALRGIVETPVIAPDGGIVETPGYDPGSGLYYTPEEGFALPPVPEVATEADYQAAARLVAGELLTDFPFRSQADRATAWALLFSLPLRPLVSGQVPLGALDAPAAGTGKGLLAKAIGVVATGRVPTMMSPPGDRDDAEWRKRITSALLGGSPLAILDNVEAPLGSPALASVLTTDSWTDRYLGRSEMVTLPARAVWLVTGNNLRLRGDLPRRCIHCRLDAKLARPWTREKFRHEDLLGWAREHRGEILAAIFTLARSWLAADRPEADPETPRLGGFEDWRHVLGGILRLAGVGRFLANLPEFYDLADAEVPAWSAFLAAWHARIPESITAARLAAALKPEGPLRDALPSELADALENAKNFTRRLGNAFARRIETRFPIEDGRTLRLARAGEEHKVALWEVIAE